MKRHLIAWLAAVLLAPVAAPMARAQSFPFEDAFTAYAPGSTGAPAWSILSGSFTTTEGMLQGPVIIRFNARPPQQFVADLTLDLRGEPDGTAPREAALYYDHQHQADTGASDVVLVRARTESGSARTELVTGVERAGSISERGTFRLAEPSGPITLRVAVDTETGRIAAFVDGKPVVTSAPAEYGAGLLSVRLSDGARLDRIVLRVPTAEEKRSLLVTTLFNDPRDIADGDNGNLIVLHRGSPAVLTVTPDGEVTRTFGRRAPGGIPDPVAVDRGSRGEVMVLNRFPGEVVVYERNGGIRYRFGADHLKEPSDLVVMPDGTTYVTDPGARAVAVFAADRRYLGSVTSFGSGSGVPVRLGRDTFGNVVVLLTDPERTVVLRPGPDHTSMALVSETETAPSDVLAADGRMLAYLGTSIVDYAQQSGSGAAFKATTVGGLERGGRLAKAGDTLWALDRSRSRIIAIPPTLAESPPDISFLNIAQTAALVRWTSAHAALNSRVRLLVNDRWVEQTQTNKAPTTDHQVPLSNLKPGQKYRYAVSPTIATIPATDWSTEYTFETAPSLAAPQNPPGTPPVATIPAEKGSDGKRNGERKR